MFKFHNRLILIFIFFISCDVKQKQSQLPKVQEKKEKIITETKKKEKPFLLNDKNAIPFFFEYEKKNKENRVRIKTKYGNIDIELFKETPYHRSNFIYLTKKKYFNGTSFHRVVKDFIIQGGNSDSYEISKRRRNIGRYLLPPDTKKGFKHHRGIVSIPSSDIENPYKLASPYEFLSFKVKMEHIILIKILHLLEKLSKAWK